MSMKAWDSYPACNTCCYVVVEVKVFSLHLLLLIELLLLIKLLSVTDDNFNFPRTGICTEYSLTFLNGIIWNQHYLCRRLVYLNTFQISSQSESVSILLIHLCLLHTKHFQSRFMEADGFSVPSHAGVFRGACFPHNEKQAPLKTPA